ncbi:enoyl reductase [Verticillium dahliae]|nr:enoyl reductase [Verticillium dahliae]
MVSSPSGGYRLASDVPQPAPQPGTMLVRVHAVSLNPYDAKIVEYRVGAPGAYVGGCDFAGVVVAVGPAVTRFRPGDRVLTINTHGGFAEYALAVEDLSCHVPDAMPYTQACSLGLAVGIAGLALFQEPGLNLPLLRGPDLGQVNGHQDEAVPAAAVPAAAVPAATVLVAGGASASGTMATRLLKLAGFNPIVTCSPANNALCESFGASACFDYHSPTCGADIRLHTDNTLAHVLDCVTDAATMAMCYEAIGAQGGAYVALEPTTNTVKYTRRDVRADWVMANTLLGDPCTLDGVYGRPAAPEHRLFAGRLFRLAERWLRDGDIWNHPLEIRHPGLESVGPGLQDLRAGIIRGKKLVVPLEVAA